MPAAKAVTEKRKPGRPRRDEPPRDQKIRIAADLAEKARRLSAHRGQKITDYIDEVLRGRIESEFAELVREPITY
jgi:hypothetical protein